MLLDFHYYCVIHVWAHECRRQRTTYGTGSPSSPMWALGLKLGSPSLHSKCVTCALVILLPQPSIQCLRIYQKESCILILVLLCPSYLSSQLLLQKMTLITIHVFDLEISPPTRLLRVGAVMQAVKVLNHFSDLCTEHLLLL